MGVSAAEIGRQLLKLLPLGDAWPRGASTTVQRLLQAAADEIARIYPRVAELLDEAHPATIDELLAEWEIELGLPPPCVQVDLTEAERRAAILSKLRQTGGQSRQYYIDVAAGLGVIITIDELQPFYVGLHGCGDEVGEIDWKFVWVINAPPVGGVDYLSCDTAVAGDALALYGSSPMLECVLQGLKPAHTILLFRYTDT